MTTYLIRATTAYEQGDYLPALRYWNAALSMWDDYSNATRYAHAEQPEPPTGPRPRSVVQVVAAHPVDAQGFPYLPETIIGPVRVTHCCAAATSISDGPFYCKSCYAETSPAYEMLAVIDSATVAPTTWSLADARDTITPLAAYATADASCVRYGCHFFATTADRDEWVTRQSKANDRAQVFTWDIDRNTGVWVLNL